MFAAMISPTFVAVVLSRPAIAGKLSRRCGERARFAQAIADEGAGTAFIGEVPWRKPGWSPPAKRAPSTMIRRMTSGRDDHSSV